MASHKVACSSSYITAWWHNHRLVPSPSLVAVGLSMEYETWSPIDCDHPFVIGCSKYRLGLPQLWWIGGSCDQGEFPPFFRGHWQSPCTALTAGKLPAVMAVEGDCETVYPSHQAMHGLPTMATNKQRECWHGTHNSSVQAPQHHQPHTVGIWSCSTPIVNSGCHFSNSLPA